MNEDDLLDRMAHQLRDGIMRGLPQGSYKGEGLWNQRSRELLEKYEIVKEERKARAPGLPQAYQQPNIEEL